MHRSIKVKIVSESSTKVTIKLMSLNRVMPVARAEFEKRVAEGLYEVIAPVQKPVAEEEE